MDQSTALTIVDASKVSIVDDIRAYGDDLAASGEVANQYARLWEFEDYHQKSTRNTQERQKYDLEVFSTFLSSMGVSRSSLALYNDANAWDGITYGHLKAFRRWQVEQGYAIGSINVRLATIRQYCRLAHKSGAISSTEMDLIKTVTGYSHKTGRNIDQDRRNQGKVTRVGHKIATPTNVSTSALRRLKRATVQPATPRRRDYDKLLEARDTLLLCLLIEHALRCSEIVGLNIEQINLAERSITVYRKKTDDIDTYELMPKTYAAASAYLALLDYQTGPLFTGYQGERLSTRAVNDRIRVIGEQEGISGLSPHDLRHAWALDALKNGTSLDVVQAYGGWKSSAMPLHYAKVAGVTHRGLKISE